MTKLSPGTLLLGIFAVLFGLIGAYAVKQSLQREPQAAPVAKETRYTVPLASTDLIPGRTLTPGDVMLVKMTRDQIENRKIPRDYMTDSRQVVGRVLQAPVKRGHAFVTTMFYPEGTGPSVAKRLKPGYRAATISLEETAAEVALLTPGALVDVILRTFPDQKAQLPETTVTLLERVEVLAIGQETFQGTRAGAIRGARTPAAATVTLAVTPEQASALKVVEGRGTMSLVLRNLDEDAVVASPAPQTLAALLGIPAPEPPFVTEIYRRGRLTTVTFGEADRTVSRQVFPDLPVGISAAPGTPNLAAAPTLAARPYPAEPETCGCEED